MKITKIAFKTIDSNKEDKPLKPFYQKYQIKDVARCMLSIDNKLELRSLTIRQQRSNGHMILFVFIPGWNDQHGQRRNYYFFNNKALKNKVKDLILAKYQLFIKHQENNFKGDWEL